MPYLFLQEDLEELKRREKALLEKCEKTGKEIGKSVRESSETWHDNAPFDVACHSLGMIGKQLKELHKLISQAKVTSPSKNKNKTGIGSIIKVYPENSKQGKWYKIGSYMIIKPGNKKGRNSERNPLIIPYSGPAGKAFLNKRKEDRVKVNLLSGVKIFIIDEIKN